MKHTKRPPSWIETVRAKFFPVLAVIFIAATAHADPTARVESSPISEMIIEDIVCEGNENTDCNFITKKYYQRIGDYVNPEEIADARFRLGAEIQFRNISVRLEKGSRRGYVIVVFLVQEASHIQYSFSAGFVKSRSEYENNIMGYYTHHEADWKRLGSEFGVTNFNFLGSGKRLGLNILLSNADSNSYTLSAYDYPDQINSVNEYSYEQHVRGVTFNLSYFDPYLSGSSRYYLYGNISYGMAQGESESTHYFDYTYFDSHRNNSENFTSTVGEFEIGRRIGSWSYVSFVAAYGNNDENRAVADSYSSSYLYGSINYGWNTEDDTIFPTEGSTLQISLRGSNYKNRYGGLIYNEGDWYFGADYRKHFSLSDRNIITVGAGTVYDPDPNETRSSVSATYTRMNALDRINGRYSGWFVETRISQVENLLEDYQDNHIYSIALGYTLQTDQVIMRFQADYGVNKRSGQ